MCIRDRMNGDRVMLSKAITLIESNAKQHYQKAQDLLNVLLSNTCPSIRIGITGVPGAGKSTFIEEFGFFLCENGHKVAVLAIDPVSYTHLGSEEMYKEYGKKIGEWIHEYYPSIKVDIAGKPTTEQIDTYRESNISDSIYLQQNIVQKITSLLDLWEV